jgi:hypothetical protein
MDKKFLNALFTGEAQHLVMPDRRQWEQRDLSQDLARNFSSVFNEEIEKESEKEAKKETREETGKPTDENQQQKSANNLIDEEQPKDNQQKDSPRAGCADKVQAEIQEMVRERLTNLSPMLNYLYNLMYKNPDALSIVERKEAGLDKLDQLNLMEEMKKHEVEYMEFKKMLQKHGLKLEDLTVEHFKKLAQQLTREELESYLDSLVREKRDELKNQGRKESSGERKDEDKEIQRTGIDNKSQQMDRPADDLDLLKTLANQDPNQNEQIQKQQKHRELVDKIIQRIDVRNLNERTELIMKLNPEFMGDLKLKLNYQDERISAIFETTSKEIRKLLDESSKELAEAFRAKSLNLINTKVVLVESVDEV